MGIRVHSVALAKDGRIPALGLTGEKLKYAPQVGL